VEQFLIIYEDTVATCSASRAGLLSRAKPIQARLSGDSTQMPTTIQLMNAYVSGARYRCIPSTAFDDFGALFESIISLAISVIYRYSTALVEFLSV